MMLNMAMWCDVARSADAAAASLRKAGVRVTTADEVPGMLRVEVACGASARTMLRSVMGAILV